MALTITNTANLYRLMNALDRNEADRKVTLARLASGRRINRAADDPAGLIALSSLQNEIAGVDASIDNNQRTKSVLDAADGALAQVNSLLGEIEGLAVASVGDTLTAAEKAANQDQIDSAIDAIDRIVNSTTFNGKKVFDGENRITAALSPADAAYIKDVHVYSRPSGSNSVALSVNVSAAAKHATTSGTVVANISAALSADTVVSISGKNGSETITLASGSNLASVVTTINGSKGLTGVSATSSGTQLILTSTDFGTEAFVSVSALSGDHDVTATANVSKVKGTDATVLVNGQAALVSGTEFFYNGNGVSMSANLAQNSTGTRTITINGGGATFQLGSSSSTRATISIGNVSSASLGRSDLGYLADLRSGGSASVANDADAAVSIVQKAVLQGATAAARLGGFSKYQVDSTINALKAQKEGLSNAASQIGDTDYAVESARLERQNLLANVGIGLLGVASSQQQALLQLLR